MGVKSHLLFSLGRHSKQAEDERHLPHDISLFHTVHLPLAKHVHHLVSQARVRHAVSNEKKPISGLTKRLRKRWSCSTMVLK